MSDKDLVEEARHLLNHPGWREPFGSDARRIVMALCDEVELLRERWNTRFNTLCGNCGKRYLGPRDEHLHGIGICGGRSDGE